MTGAEHYREAERLLAEAREAIKPTTRSAYPLEPGQPTSAELYERNIAEAQVHAILALAAPRDPDSGGEPESLEGLTTPQLLERGRKLGRENG